MKPRLVGGPYFPSDRCRTYCFTSSIFIFPISESEFDEGDDEEDDESEEDDVFAEAEVENATMSSSPLRNNKSTESNQRALRAAHKPEELREQYERFFLEYMEEDKVCPEYFFLILYLHLKLFSFQQKFTTKSFIEDDFLHSGKVRGLVPFYKSSYPDMISAGGLNGAAESLASKDKRVYR